MGRLIAFLALVAVLAYAGSTVLNAATALAADHTTNLEGSQ